MGRLPLTEASEILENTGYEKDLLDRFAPGCAGAA